MSPGILFGMSVALLYTKPSEKTMELRERLPGMDAASLTCSVARSNEYRTQQAFGSCGVGPSTYSEEPSALAEIPLSPTGPTLKFMRARVASVDGSINST